MGSQLNISKAEGGWSNSEKSATSSRGNGAGETGEKKRLRNAGEEKTHRQESEKINTARRQQTGIYKQRDQELRGTAITHEKEEERNAAVERKILFLYRIVVKKWMEKRITNPTPTPPHPPNQCSEERLWRELQSHLL